MAVSLQFKKRTFTQTETNPQSLVSSQPETNLQDTGNKTPVPQEESIKDLNCSQSEENIRVVDNIPNSLKPQNSTEIKKRVKECCSNTEIKIKYSYTLAKGGIAIHTETGKDAETLDTEIGKIFPGSICKNPLSKTSTKSTLN